MEWNIVKVNKFIVAVAHHETIPSLYNGREVRMFHFTTAGRKKGAI